jgi:hypothetical protein
MYHDPICNFKHEKLQIYIYIPKYELDQILQTNRKIKKKNLSCLDLTGHNVSFQKHFYTYKPEEFVTPLLNSRFPVSQLSQLHTKAMLPLS